ncbi:hypothetical protein [[Clostridium] colinum]|uniref:hypothetical protein n=1 Tax=[Clostridium] colinum TaxID=36835 RepID=UPI002024365E|nr:hypothetical protein [[Clostridium] colinum]
MKIYYYCFKNYNFSGYTIYKNELLEFIEKYNIPEEEIIIKEFTLLKKRKFELTQEAKVLRDEASNYNSDEIIIPFMKENPTFSGRRVK